MEDEELIARNYLKQFKEKVPANYSSKSVMKKYYRSMNERVSKSYSYKRKGIKVEISLEEFEKFWFDNLEKMLKIQSSGFIVSVDRINSMGNYRIDNIRIIPLELNRALGKIEQLQNQLKRLYKFADSLKEWV